MRRAQGSLEFILLVATLLLISVVYSSFVTERILVSNEERFYFLFKDSMNALRMEFLMASAAEEGYTRTFFVPSTIDGRVYTLQIFNTSLVANTSVHEVFMFIPLVIGSFQNGNNTLHKQGGVLYLN